MRGFLSLVLFALFVPAPSRASDWSDKLELSGYVSSDLRYIIEDDRGIPDGDGYRFQTNRNDINLRLDILPSERVRAVIDARLRFYGFQETETMGQLFRRDAIDPWSLHLDEAYVSIQGFLVDSLDLSLGRMVKTWGAADQFNPTDNISARDFSDPLDYASKIPNQMLELSANPTDWLSLSLVFVPVFKPAQLPTSAGLGFAVESDAQGCFQAAPIPPLGRGDLAELETLFTAIPACDLNFLDADMGLVLPEASLANSQVAVKAALQVWDIDLSFSYYYGRFAFPVAYTAVADVALSEERPGVFDVLYQAELMYPRMQVVGADFSWPMAWLFDVKLWGEIAVIFPEEVVFGLHAYQEGAQVVNQQAVNVPADPFIKATTGMDYTLAWGTYLNVQYVYGFFDEFNDAYGMHHYLVPAVEQKFFSDELRIRLAGAYDLVDDSATFFPELAWVLAPGVELSGGVLMLIGDTEPADPYDYASKSKFGQKAYGRNVAFIKAKGSF